VDYRTRLDNTTESRRHFARLNNIIVQNDLSRSLSTYCLTWLTYRNTLLSYFNIITFLFVFHVGFIKLIFYALPVSRFMCLSW